MVQIFSQYFAVRTLLLAVWEQPAQAGQLNADNVPDLVYATLPYDNTGAWTGRPVQIGVIDGGTHAMRWTADVG